MLLLGLVFLVCYLIAQPAIIDAVNKITRGGQYRFGESFSRGVDFMWRFLGLTVFSILVFMAVVFAVVILAVITPFTLLLTIPVALVAFFFLFPTFALAEVALVARDGTVGDAIMEGWQLVIRNKVNCLIAGFLLVGIGIGFAIVFGIVGLVTFLPIGIAAAAITGNVFAVILLALFLGLPVSLVMGGYSGTFMNAFYVQFYFRMYEPETAVEASGPTYPTA